VLGCIEGKYLLFPGTGLGFSRGFGSCGEAGAAAQVLDAGVLGAMHVPGRVCMHARVCAAESARCFDFPADAAAVPAGGQYRRLEARAGDSPSPRPLRLQLPWKPLSPPLPLLGLSVKPLTSSLQGFLPAPAAGTDLALLPSCPVPAERRGDVPQRGEQGGTGAAGETAQLCRGGLGSSVSILLLHQPVHLSPVEISAGFACAGAGLTLRGVHAEPRRGRLSLQQVKL